MHKHPLTFHMVSRNNLVDKHNMLKKKASQYPVRTAHGFTLYKHRRSRATFALEAKEAAMIHGLIELRD